MQRRTAACLKGRRQKAKALKPVFDRLSATTELRDKLERNTMWFRQAMTEAGFAIKEGVHAIVPIMLGDAKLAADVARDMLDEGIYVIGFSFPVVPRGHGAMYRLPLQEMIVALKKSLATMNQLANDKATAKAAVYRKQDHHS